MLTEIEESPQPAGATAGQSAARAVPAPTSDATVTERSFPRHYLAIESQRLYPFTIEAKHTFDHYARLIQAPLSDYTFANNIIWLSQKSGFYQIIEDCFCLFSL